MEPNAVCGFPDDIEGEHHYATKSGIVRNAWQKSETSLAQAGSG
ncbi:MAG TPA: hypothetical protein PLS58_11775 [Bacteroidales bacterium]|nr:hypothetical protein [Bacteroidales bacterium]